MRLCEWDSELATCLADGWFQLFGNGTGLAIAQNLYDAAGSARPVPGDFTRTT